jgi:hypothetical protein
LIGVNDEGTAMKNMFAIALSTLLLAALVAGV